MIRAPATWSPAAVSVLVTLCLASAACSNAENNDPDVGAVVASDGIAVDGSALDAPDLQGDLPDAQADTQTGELDAGTDDVATDTVAASDAADEPNDGTADDSTDAEIADTAPDAAPETTADVPDDTAPEDVTQQDVWPDGTDSPDLDAGGQGCTGCPCASNGDCGSGFCIEAESGPVCAPLCSPGCPAGYDCKTLAGAAGATSVCVPMHARLCEPCAKDSDCWGAAGVTTARCLPYVAASGSLLGSFCGAKCEGAADCPAGFGCEQVVTADGTAKQCKKLDLTCACDTRAVALGLGTACGTAGQDGLCKGVRFCTALGLEPCDAPAPQAETCNGDDDDCDGQPDDGALCDDGDPCTLDACQSGQCTHLAAAGACNDGNACTTQDACANGSCVGSAVDCNDGSVCTADACAPASGCSHLPQAGSCQDGNACSGPDSCQAGQCVAGGKVDCEDGNACTLDACDVDVGCLHASLDGKACDDGNPCTTGDACKASACASGSPKTCDDSDACTTDACAAATGSCTHTDVPDCGGPCKKDADCDDQNVCTSDVCFQGVGCLHSNTILPCTDGTSCTTGFTCQGGACKGPNGLGKCDDANPCTTDACDPALGCLHAANAAPCSDGTACTVNDGCVDSKCQGSPKVCDDLNPCTDDGCDPVKGCTATANAATCSDGDACTVSDKCDKGVCKAGAVKPCGDSDACTLDACSSVTGICSHKPVVCADNNACTTDGCDAAKGCQFLYNTSACDDGDACTAKDACAAGTCKGTAVDCDDGNPCTADACDKGTGCVSTPTTAACSDGNACTDNDKCASGKCMGAAKTCEDGNVCTANECQPGWGCVFPPSSGACPDSDACTAQETCANGQCVTQPVDCDDGDPCTKDSCVVTTGCAHQASSDGTDCGTGKACLAGKCEVKSGCAPGMKFVRQIEPDLWLCAVDNITGNNTYQQVYSACNEAMGFHMGTVSSMTRRGLPSNANIAPAMTWIGSQGFDYAVTGQPVRSFSWDYNKTSYEGTNCGSGGLGYIHKGETDQNGSNWKALTDGNANDYRDWPSANCVEVSYHTLIALCQDATADAQAYVFDHRWR
jgi:hypothetical protein